jgi:hypothetical protein
MAQHAHPPSHTGGSPLWPLYDPQPVQLPQKQVELPNKPLRPPPHTSHLGAGGGAAAGAGAASHPASSPRPLSGGRHTVAGSAGMSERPTFSASAHQANPQAAVPGPFHGGRAVAEGRANSPLGRHVRQQQASMRGGTYHSAHEQRPYSPLHARLSPLSSASRPEHLGGEGLVAPPAAHGVRRLTGSPRGSMASPVRAAAAPTLSDPEERGQGQHAGEREGRAHSHSSGSSARSSEELLPAPRHEPVGKSRMWTALPGQDPHE